MKNENSQAVTARVEEPWVSIEPRKGWIGIDWADMWLHRDLFVMLMIRNIKIRYKQTVLGALWAILQPVIAAAIFTLVVGRVMKGPTQGVPAFIFYYSGLLPWTLFSAVVSGAAQSLITNERLMTKVYFPRLLIPLSVIGYALLDFVLAAVVFAVVMLVTGFTPTFQPGYLLLSLPAVLLCALGVGVALSALTVKYRDFRFVVPFLLQVWLYASPVIYPLAEAEKYSRTFYWLLNANPLAGLITGFRAGLVGTGVESEILAVGMGISLILLLAGFTYFRQVEDYFADIV